MTTARQPGWAGDPAAERLFSLVCAACAPESGLPAQLAAGLRAALSMLATEPETAWLLTVGPHVGSDLTELRAQDEWIGRFGELLRDAADGDPRTSRRSSFLAPYLVGGVRFQIARVVLADETSDLLRLLPGTLEALLAYWFEPGEPIVLARAALDG